MPSIPVGAAGSSVLCHATSGQPLKDVTLPPSWDAGHIMVMENAALNAIKPYLDAGRKRARHPRRRAHLRRRRRVAASPAKRRSPMSMGGASSFRSCDRRERRNRRGHTRTRGDTAVEAIGTMKAKFG